MIVCILLPRFELSVATGGMEALAGRALALAPDGGASQRIGEVSGAAQAFGVRAGMALGEALARCPGLELVVGDPVAVEAAWEGALRRLEGIGAAVEAQRPGVACFDARPLRGLHGGSEERVIDVALRSLGRPARAGAGATRFCALAAALGARPRRPQVLRGDARVHLQNLPVSMLRSREECAALVGSLERLGLATLGELAALPSSALADRFGRPGLLAHRLARGEDDPPCPRACAESLEELFELPESALGPQLEQALGVLIDRLLARPERHGRTLRAVTLAAQLVDGGSWRVAQTFREALSDPRRMRLALAPRIAVLPSPARALSLCAASFGPASGEQRALLEQPLQLRRARLREAVRQARAAAGADAALRVLCVDLPSRIPERRVMLAPFEG
ncbi:MAG: hypothetical protein ACR2ND_03640 [Solirubrobacteraceae bacterium]